MAKREESELIARYADVLSAMGTELFRHQPFWLPAAIPGTPNSSF